jgi:hypothetical protein
MFSIEITVEELPRWELLLESVGLVGPEPRFLEEAEVAADQEATHAT